MPSSLPHRFVNALHIAPTATPRCSLSTFSGSATPSYSVLSSCLVLPCHVMSRLVFVSCQAVNAKQSFDDTPISIILPGRRSRATRQIPPDAHESTVVEAQSSQFESSMPPSRVPTPDEPERTYIRYFSELLVVTGKHTRSKHVHRNRANPAFELRIPSFKTASRDVTEGRETGRACLPQSLAQPEASPSQRL